eukprot:g8564.t1
MMETGDVVVTVEHCHGCHRHRMTTRHDPEVYLRHANAVREILIEILQEAPIRLAIVLKKTKIRCKALPRGGVGNGATGATANAARQWRVGAFEIQVAARHPDRAHQLHVRVVHSKLASGRWPRLETGAQLPTRVKATLASWGFESNRREVSSVDDATLGSKGAGSETPSEYHRPPVCARISWEFDNRDSLLCAAAPAVPVPPSERHADSNIHASDNNHGNSKTRAGRASTSASSGVDAQQRRGQTRPHGTSGRAGAATVANGDLGDAPLASPGGSAGGGIFEAGTTVGEASGRSFGEEGRDEVAGDGGGIPDASDGAGASFDVAIGRKSVAGPPENAPAIAVAAANSAGSSAATKARTTPLGLHRSGSREDDSDEGKQGTPEDTGLFRSVRPEPLVDASDYDSELGDRAPDVDVSDVDRVDDTPPRSGRGRRRKSGGEDGGYPALSARESNSGDVSRISSLMCSVRGLQGENVQSRPVGEVQGAPHIPNEVRGERVDIDAGGNRASTRVVEGNPASADGGESFADSVWSNSNKSRGSPKTEGEAISTLEAPPIPVGYDGQEKSTPTSREGADSGETLTDNRTAAEPQRLKFLAPASSHLGAHTRGQGHGVSDDGGGGDEGSGRSVASLVHAGVVDPTSKVATQHAPAATEIANTSDVESRRSIGYPETGEVGGRGKKPPVGVPSTARREHDGAAEDDEYGSDFASQDDSSVEEVHEGSSISEGSPPLVLPREDSDIAKIGEEFQWPDAEYIERVVEEDEEDGVDEEGEEEYGDDFDDDGGDFA